jgi:Ca2+-binding EF-hand superfamily protein
MKKLMIKKMMLGIGLFLFPFCLFSMEENNSTTHPLIKKFDKDKDGKIFYTEASKELQEKFCQYDVNQDAYIDEIEVEAIK